MKLYRDFTSQEEIDQEYNLTLSVPDYHYWLDWYQDQSARARVEFQCELDQRFGPTLDETVDIFPAREPGSALLVFIHGGYWFRCSSKDFSYVARGLVPRGVSVAVTNYALCPKVSVSEITRQSRAAIAWLYRQAGNYNASPQRIFVCGHSAGGQQVGMLAATDWFGEYGLPGNIIKGGIAISGIFDLSPLCYSYLQPRLLLSHEEILRQSPYFNIPQSGPPIMVSNGENETAEFHRQAGDYHKSRRIKELSGELVVQPGKHHFSAIEGLNTSNSPLSDSIIDFIERCERAEIP